MKHSRYLVLLILVLPVLAACYPPAGPVAPTSDSDITNVVPETTVYEPGQCSAVLDAPAPAYTSNTLSGPPSGEIPAGRYQVGVAADYGSRLFFLLNDAPAPANWVDGADVSSLEGLCAGATNPIVDIVWQWTSVTDQTTRDVNAVPDPASYTIVFNADGSLRGQADCNSFSGVYSQEAGFSITVDTITEMYCGDTSLDRQYLQLLDQVAAGGPDGADNLALETAGGAQRMLFKNGGPAAAP